MGARPNIISEKRFLSARSYDSPRLNKHFVKAFPEVNQKGGSTYPVLKLILGDLETLCQKFWYHPPYLPSLPLLPQKTPELPQTHTSRGPPIKDKKFRKALPGQVLFGINFRLFRVFSRRIQRYKPL